MKISSPYAVCQVAVAPLRRVASDRSEQVSQLLFGEGLEILEARGRSWIYVRSRRDGYLGWMDPKQALPVDYEWLQEAEQKYALALETTQPAFSGDAVQLIPAGASLPFFDGMSFALGTQRFQYSGQAIMPGQHPIREEMVIKLSRRYLYAPYAWGGRSPLGIDCSGYTQLVFAMLNVALPRDASQQVHCGEEVPFAALAQVGDLAFFENGKGRIIHVGIVMPESKILHASGRVREDLLDSFGIYQQESQRYTHDLRVIKRLLPDFPKKIKLGLNPASAAVEPGLFG